MTVFELYKTGLLTLQAHQIEDAAVDADLLFSEAFGKDKSWRIVHAGDRAEELKASQFLSFVERRVKGEPLQYILGAWSFFGRDFSVGDGVLIPRPETEELVERALELLPKDSPQIVYDLCAGSGAIGLTVALERPNCTVYLFEKYDAAFSYLEKNKNALGVQNVKLIQADVLKSPDETLPQADMLLSNPPYIPSSEVLVLQQEVQREPHTALDGGEDGLCFYRAIRSLWLNRVKKDGYLLFECGNHQAKEISSLFAGDTAKQNVLYDFNAVDRIVEINV